MTLERAIRLEVGNIVWCPADRGEDGYSGTVTSVGGSIANAGVTQYIWIEVQTPRGHKSVWPSNRLG